MTSTSDIRLSVCREAELGVTPNPARMQIWAHSGESLVCKPDYEDDPSISFDGLPNDPVYVGQSNNGTIKFPLRFPDVREPFNDVLCSVMRADWVQAPHRGAVDNKQIVVAAATGVNHNLSVAAGYIPPFYAGRVIDGVALDAGDLVLVMGQNNKAENGVYTTIVNPDYFRVEAVTTANVVLANVVAGTVIDNVTLRLNDRVLVRSQTTQSQNGVYYVTGSGLIRDNRFDDTIDQFSSVLFRVMGGISIYKYFEYTGPTTGSIGSVNITFGVKTFTFGRSASYDTWAELEAIPLVRVASGNTFGGNIYKVTAETGGTLGTTNIEVALDTTSSGIFAFKFPSVFVAAVSTANVTISTGLENGDTLDGVTLKTGDLVLLKSQTTAAENGIYTVPASGAASRPSAYDSWNELVDVTFIAAGGTTNGGKYFKSTATAGGGTLGTTAITFVERTTAPVVVGAAGNPFKVGHIVKFTNLGTNTTARVAIEGDTEPEFPITSISYVASPSSDAEMRVVGFQGEAGDISCSASGYLNSVSLDFTTLGLQKEMWIKIAGFEARPARNAWVQIEFITAHSIKLTSLPADWGPGTDAGTGVAVKVFFGDVLNFGRSKIGMTIDRTAMLHTPQTHIVQEGMVTGMLDLTIQARKSASGNATLRGLRGSTTPKPGASYIKPLSTTIRPVFAGGPSVGSLRLGGAVGNNWVRSITLKIDNSAADQEDITADGIAGIALHEPAITLTAEALFSDATFLNKLLNREKVSFETRLAAASQALTMTVHRLSITDGSPSADAKKKDVMMTLQMTAAKRDDGKLITFNRHHYFE